MNALAVVLLASYFSASPARLPISFDADVHWSSRPTFLSNPALNAQALTERGHVTLRVDEPGRGMKFELALSPSSMWPGSILQMHEKVTVLIDEAAASRLERREYYAWVAQQKRRLAEQQEAS